MTIASKPVYSSHITNVGYDSESQELHIEYKTGKTAVYQGVPSDIANQVMNAGSVGTALHLLVKGTYGHEYKG